MDLIEEKIERYAQSHSSAESILLRQLAEETHKKTDMPQMQVGPIEGRFLKLLVSISKAKQILEIGTFTGYSALCMAEGLPDHGILITCDINPRTAEIAKKFWAKSQHGRKIQLKLGPALDTLKELKDSFDIVFIDADKENYTSYWEACIPKLRSGGLMVVDNVLWSGRVLKPKDTTDRAIHSFNCHASNDPRMEVVMLTVRDGITLAVKK